jgi:hypothetical protein
LELSFQRGGTIGLRVTGNRKSNTEKGKRSPRCQQWELWDDSSTRPGGKPVKTGWSMLEVTRCKRRVLKDDIERIPDTFKHPERFI